MASFRLCLLAVFILTTLCVLTSTAPRKPRSISSSTSFFQRTDLKVDKKAQKKRLCWSCADDDLTNYRLSRKQHKNVKKISSTAKPTYVSMYQQQPERDRYRSRGPCLEGQRKDILGYCRDIWGSWGMCI